jgi:N-acetylmuramate 1-kinase
MESRIRAMLDRTLGVEAAHGARLENRGGHASLRIYWRVHLDSSGPRGERRLMAMVMPQSEAAYRSEEGGGSVGEVPEELSFVDVQRYLHGLGLPVPEIDGVDMDLGVLLLEDLGDEMFEDAYLELGTRTDRIALYEEAIGLLVEFQRATSTDGHRRTSAWEKRFDSRLLRWELDHYLEWGLEAQYGALKCDREALSSSFTQIVDELLSSPQTLVLRDYQSRNIMRKNGRWVLIDFQDALVGSCAYDLVALLRDSYIELDAAAVDELIDIYLVRGREASLPWCEDPIAFRRVFHLQTVQRKLKDAGRFVFIDRVKANPNFLHYYPSSLRYVSEALSRITGAFELARLLGDADTQYPG